MFGFRSSQTFGATCRCSAAEALVRWAWEGLMEEVDGEVSQQGSGQSQVRGSTCEEGA